MNIHRSIGLILTGTCGLAIAGPALAQNSDATTPNAQPPAVQSEGDQNAIIVTAQKRPQVLIDVPQSVSVISGDTLENTHAQRLSDYLTRIPSATVVESQPGNSRIVLRGINTGGVGATVATYIDETPFGSATALANGAILTPDIDPFDLARVEVLRGPQGTLYGANSLGGLVKFVTVAPDPGAFDGAAELCSKQRGSLANVLRAGLDRYAIVRDAPLDRQAKIQEVQKAMDQRASMGVVDASVVVGASGPRREQRRAPPATGSAKRCSPASPAWG